ncbi:MAG: BREX-6 system adenine-specific DNA-methyltransferase PglX, partial [Myxococcota bacterium]|nr:BREX-6 system adenine-specific DNA-methyltransferase PglX [Myxococcota bacterium]
MKAMNPESKPRLRKTIRELREVLLRELEDYSEQQYLLKLDWKKNPRLTAEKRERRRRLEAAIAERAAEDKSPGDAKARAFAAAYKEVGATLLNRLVLIRHLEALNLSRPAVVTGGWKSPGYQQFRSMGAALCDDDTQGLGTLLQLLFDELAVALPGLFGNVGLTALIPIPPATLRKVVEALDEVPADVWQDDMTLGWVYQYWNDPDREALDEKLHERGKLEPHEIASKTQMFTERYMVDWLLQNSLGPTWLALCQKNGWTPEVKRDGVLDDLDARRAEWRGKRERREVEQDALMPTAGEVEEAWRYYVPQPLPEEVVKHAPTSLRELKLLDPACGSGHFLVVAFDLLTTLYREEARHRGESWSDRQIAEWILERNLHGVDIDPRAVQIAAAGLYLKAKALAKDAAPAQLNLVAPALRLGTLPDDDPALLKLKRDIEEETGIPPELTQQLIAVLSGVDHLGTLLKVGDAVDKALAAFEGRLGKAGKQTDLFAAEPAKAAKAMPRADAKRTILAALERFLASHRGEEDLGLRLRGQQLASGLRFATIVREGEYHLVVGNPPYQGTSRMKDAKYIAKHYPKGKSDLYAAFLERGLELCREGGASAMVTMRSWMFLSGFTALREHLLKTFDLRAIGDVDRGAFDEVPNEVLATAMSVFRRTAPASEPSVAMQPTPLSDKSYDRNRTARKRAAVLAQVGRFEFGVRLFEPVDGWPLTYWWPPQKLDLWANNPSLGTIADVRQGLATADNGRFLRKPWEIAADSLATEASAFSNNKSRWAPFVKGGAGRVWLEPVSDVIRWDYSGLQLRLFDRAVMRNPTYNFRQGVAFSPIGSQFTARLVRAPSVFGNMGSAVFPRAQSPRTLGEIVCLMNSATARSVLESLNPGIHFEVGDVVRLPALRIRHAERLVESLVRAFEIHESGREQSVQFRKPGASTWAATQSQVQRLLDADESTTLADHDHGDSPGLPPSRDALRSFKVGVLLGRFDPNGNGVAIQSHEGSSSTEILFVGPELRARPQLEELARSFNEFDVNSEDVAEWLRTGFFEYHLETYEHRPIYFPIASRQRTFVAYVSIHRWTNSTLTELVANHLLPERKALEGALADLQTERSKTGRQIQPKAERRYLAHKRWLEELEEFIALVHEVAERGPPPADSETPPRELDARFEMALDDGVVVNSAA